MRFWWTVLMVGSGKYILAADKTVTRPNFRFGVGRRWCWWEEALSECMGFHLMVPILPPTQHPNKYKQTISEGFLESQIDRRVC